MARDGEIPAIFNPKRVRAPSVVVTGDSPNGPFGGFTTNLSHPQIVHSDSVSSSQHDGGGGGGGGGDSIIGITTSIGDIMTITPTCGPGGELLPITNTTTTTNSTTPITSPRLKACKDSCCSELAQKMYFGVCVTILVTATWVGATHCIKYLYIRRNSYSSLPINTLLISDGGGGSRSTSSDNSNTMIDNINLTTESSSPTSINLNPQNSNIFNAPFFASWFCTNFAILFFPIYMLGRITINKCESPCDILGDVLRGFRDRGFTAGRFLNRCMTFCMLWLLTTYLFALSLRALLATDVMALFATNVACVYLLSWVILHEQFVGVRVSFYFYDISHLCDYIIPLTSCAHQPFRLLLLSCVIPELHYSLIWTV